MSYVVVLGTNSIDEYYDMDCIPVMGEKVICTPRSIEVGGMLGNAAAVLAGYGQKTYMIDYLNSGSNTQLILDSMRKANVDASFFTIDDSVTDSKCQVLLYNGERVIFVMPKNKQAVKLTDEQLDLIKGAGCVYTSPTELRVFSQQRLLEQMKNSGVKLALDIEAGTLTQGELDWKILSAAFVIFVNGGGDEKLRVLYGEDYIGKLNETGCMIVRTCGSEGCQIYAKNESPIKIPGLDVSVVDTTGAGDTFNSSFVFGLLQNWDLKKCGEFANGAAGKSIGLFGPRSGISKEEDVWSFLHNKKGDKK